MDSLGAPELIIVVVMLGLFVFPTVYGAYKAFTSGDIAWGVAILLAWIIAAGWLVGIVYLIQRRFTVTT